MRERHELLSSKSNRRRGRSRTASMGGLSGKSGMNGNFTGSYPSNDSLNASLNASSPGHSGRGSPVMGDRSAFGRELTEDLTDITDDHSIDGSGNGSSGDDSELDEEAAVLGLHGMSGAAADGSDDTRELDRELVSMGLPSSAFKTYRGGSSLAYNRSYEGYTIIGDDLYIDDSRPHTHLNEVTVKVLSEIKLRKLERSKSAIILVHSH